MEQILIIGGGVVGMWTAIKAAKRGYKVTLVEQGTLGGMASTRNSGVLHAGIYYTQGSQKAKHCVEGNAQTLSYLQKNNIPHLQCGKLIVPVPSEFGYDNEESHQLPKLEDLRIKAINNGVQDVEIVRTNHDFLKTKIALHVKNTAIVDLSYYIKSLIAKLDHPNVQIYLASRLVEYNFDTKEVILLQNQEKIIKLKTGIVINAAGIFADSVANLFGMEDYFIRPNKGVYFKLLRSLPIKTLIYPLPEENSTHLGKHYTIDTEGNAYAGPNAVWAENKYDYKNTADINEFYADINRYINGYKLEDLLPCERTGLRARLFSRKTMQSVDDFTFIQYPYHVIHVMGIESPGFTSSPSIAQQILTMIDEI